MPPETSLIWHEHRQQPRPPQGLWPMTHERLQEGFRQITRKLDQSSPFSPSPPLASLPIPCSASPNCTLSLKAVHPKYLKAAQDRNSIQPPQSQASIASMILSQKVSQFDRRFSERFSRSSIFGASRSAPPDLTTVIRHLRGSQTGTRDEFLMPCGTVDEESASVAGKGAAAGLKGGFLRCQPEDGRALSPDPWPENGKKPIDFIPPLRRLGR